MKYQDYVIKDGKLIGKFEQMYAESPVVPWHQDEMAYSIFSEVDISCLRKLNERYSFESVVDVGCGLGHFTDRMFRDAFGEKIPVCGFDISETAIEKAQDLFPQIEFAEWNIVTELEKVDKSFSLVVSKDILWYVLDHLQSYRKSLSVLSDRFVYISQTFPHVENFLGQDVFPDPMSVIDFFSNDYTFKYYSIEIDEYYQNRPLLRALMEIKK